VNPLPARWRATAPPCLPVAPVIRTVRVSVMTLRS
jgi:hypothetical protein